MEETDVIIVGAGPAGLSLAISLAHYNIYSIVLEKNAKICEDPRAIAIAGDTSRIVKNFGISNEKMEEIGSPMPSIQFHDGVFTSTPFHTIDQKVDWLEQTTDPGVVILQPGLERALRDRVEQLKQAELREQCTVSGVEETEKDVCVRYEQHDGTISKIKGKFLVGADGKRGYIRKSYLEAKGIEQLPGIYPYEATWIAANLHISLPTPESHPLFPLWRFGFQPEELWDIFWPEGFHFCRHPTMPVAAGRFGPAGDKYFRFEYELPPNFLPADLEQHLYDQLQDHVKLPSSVFRRNGQTVDAPVEYPKDCIRVLRLGPAQFTQRVANRWSYGKVVLIGDAAHVFPPFGGQGIANGIRDAFALSWRLKLLCDGGRLAQHVDREVTLERWSSERKKGIDDACILTARNGDLLLGKSWMTVLTLRVMGTILNWFPWYRDRLVKQELSDVRGFSGVRDGFFLDGEHGGGTKIAQVHVKTLSGDHTLSDALIWQNKAMLTLLLLRSPSITEAEEIKDIIKNTSLPGTLLATDILHYCRRDEMRKEAESTLSIMRFTPMTLDELSEAGISTLRGYDPANFRNRFHPTALCALLRPDFIIFSQAQSTSQLSIQMKFAAQKLVKL